MPLSLPQLGTDKLTHSSMTCFKTCPRKFFYSYRLGLRRDRDQTALRMGSALHLGLDLMAKGTLFEMALAVVREGYAVMPKWVENGGPEAYYDWQIEQTKVETLLCGYSWRYQADNINVIESETAFSLAIQNPATSGYTDVFRFAGKIDKIIRLDDGRLAVMEHKSTVSDIDIASGYWDILGLDTQISGYMHAAGKAGHDVQTVLYDVIRKPSIRPQLIDVLDEQGLKIVLDASGNRVLVENILKNGKPGARHGEPRQSGDKEKGWVVQTRRETPEEYGKRLLDDIQANPDRYYARREIPRTEGDLEEFREELWQIQQTVRATELNGRWFRNTSACKSNYGMCEFLDLCHSRYDPKRDGLPPGFVQIEDVHPELSS